MQQAKVNLEDLMAQHDIMFRTLALAGAPSTAIWALKQGDPVDQDRAEQVIKAFNTLCGTSYTLNDIEVVLCSKETPCYLHIPKLPAFVSEDLWGAQ